MTSYTVDQKRPSRLNPLLVVRVLQALLWLLVASGPLAALLLATQVWALGDRLEAVEGRAGFELPADTSGAEGFAELYVAAYLEAGEESAQPLNRFVDGVSLEGMAAGSWLATRTTSLGAETVGPGYFAVTVAADVMAADPESDDQSEWVQVGTLFYTVGVVETENGWAATGLPTLVTPPTPTAVADLLVDRLDGLDETPGLGDMAERFLTAYLAGEGELARYTAPESQIAPPRPAPFVVVDILEAGFVDTPEGDRRVALTVGAADAAGRVQVLDYWLAVSQRDGRWEVSEILPAPPLASAAD